MTEHLTLEPADAHNEALARNVHPPDWVNPEPAKRYNMVVIGAGTAGLVTAAGVAGLGGKVALVERALMGGDCLNVGCVPSKCVIRASRAAAAVRRAKDFGIHVPDGVEIDFGAAMERMRRLRSGISDDDSVERFASLGVDVFLGQGQFAGPDTVEVAGKTLRFSRACIATGARAWTPPVEGLAEAGYLTNETVFNLTERPARLAILGGGPIGCELGQAFARLGCDVTIFEKGAQFLAREDRDAADILLRAFETERIRTLLDTAVTRVTTSGAVKTLHFIRGGREDSLDVDEILVAVGRAPNVQDMGLENVDVKYDKRTGVHVNDRLQTTNPRIYAAGDVCMTTKFTHAADAAARIVIQNALFWGRKKLSALTIPWCTYTDPEIAHVGMYEKDAADRGIEVETLTRELKDVHRAIADGETEGFARVHLKRGTDRILGATIVASHAGEMIGELSLAISAGVGLGKIASVIHPYPTQAEAIKQLGDAYSRTRLTPTLKKIFTKLLAWKR